MLYSDRFPYSTASNINNFINVMEFNTNLQNLYAGIGMRLAARDHDEYEMIEAMTTAHNEMRDTYALCPCLIERDEDLHNKREIK